MPEALECVTSHVNVNNVLFVNERNVKIKILLFLPPRHKKIIKLLKETDNDNVMISRYPKFS